MNEVWKDIKGYEGYYQISNLGKVKSLERVVVCGKAKFIKKETIIKSNKRKDGYANIVLSVKGVKTNFLTHRLVAEAFLHKGDKTEVNHIDGNKFNNNVCNLEWVTHKENQQHAVNIGLMRVGEDCVNSRLKNADKVIILKMRSDGLKVREIAEHFGVNISVIKGIIYRKAWSRV